MKAPIEPKKESGVVANSIEDKVHIAMNEVIALAMEGGMHSIYIIEELQRQIEQLREDTARVDREGRV